MKIETTKVTKLVISEADRLDPVHVFLEDIGPRQGRITINCYGQSWTAYWGGMGDRTIAQFFQSCDEYYLAGKLSNIRASVTDFDAIQEQAKRLVLKLRRERDISLGKARELFDAVNQIGHVDRGEDLPREIMEAIYGDDWWCRLPEKPNPEHQYLCRIINTVKAALGSNAE